MEKQRIGRSDLTISPVGMGCVTFGREIDEEMSLRLLDYAAEHGITFFDTSEAYGGGNAKAARKERYDVEDTREVSAEMYSSEKILGHWLKRGNRSDCVVCTKVASGNSPDNIRRQVEASLERLGVDRIDVYKLHNLDPVVPIDETLDALNEQVDAGKIGAIGYSNCKPHHLGEALALSRSRGYARFEIIQVPYSLADRSVEAELLPLAAREEISIASYSPLAAGFVTGKYSPTDERQSFPKGSGFDVSPAHADIYFSDHNFRVIDHLRRKSEELDLPMVRLAMAWAMTNPQITAVLIGARKIDHIDNALVAFDVGMDPQLRDEMSAWA